MAKKEAKGVHIICVGCKARRVLSFEDANNLTDVPTCKEKMSDGVECGSIMVLQKVVS